MNKAKTVLVFTFNHPNLVTENFGISICNALNLFGFDARFISVTQDLTAQLSTIDLKNIEFIISIGPLTLNVTLDGKPIYKFFDCPFYYYILDPPIYDCARFPSAIEFIKCAISDTRLKIGFAEKSYMRLFENYFKAAGVDNLSNLNFLPFAGFPTHCKIEKEKRKKLLVVGGLGTELPVEGVKKSDSLKDLISLNNPYRMEPRAVDLLIDNFYDENFVGNVTKVIMDTWKLDPAEIINLEFIKLSCAVDSFLKFNNRIAVIESAIGVEIDFYGPGWANKFKGVPGFNFYHDIKHNQIAEISSKYCGLINFDPNWEHGVHDRVFTGIASGASVITNKNFFYNDDEFNNISIFQYRINKPNVKELSEEVFDTYANNQSNIEKFISRHNWFERVRFLARSI